MTSVLVQGLTPAGLRPLARESSSCCTTRSPWLETVTRGWFSRSCSAGPDDLEGFEGRPQSQFAREMVRYRAITRSGAARRRAGRIVVALH
jgi:hypothetical protein